MGTTVTGGRGEPHGVPAGRPVRSGPAPRSGQPVTRRPSPLLRLSDDDLAALSAEERNELARRLAALSAPASRTASRRRSPLRRWAPVVLGIGACLAMIPWIMRLAATLPDRYVTYHWSTTWVGFDSLLLVSFAVTAWATRRRGSAYQMATLVTATLLGCDAWFDVTTAASGADLTASLITAIAGELPLAAILIYLGFRSDAGRAAPARFPAGRPG